MDVAIRRTTVTPTEDGSVVQLHISDAPLEDLSGEIVLQLSVSLRKRGHVVLVEQIQHEAMAKAQRALSALLQERLGQIVKAGFDELREE